MLKVIIMYQTSLQGHVLLLMVAYNYIPSKTRSLYILTLD